MVGSTKNFPPHPTTWSGAETGLPGETPLAEVRYLALADLEKKRERSIRDWSNVLGQFAVFFKDRLPNL